MDDRFNTIAGWVLGAGIVALGATLVTGELFKHEHHVKGGFEVADAEPTAGGGATVAEPTDFSKGDPAKGAELFKKCASCHTITPGGANGIGPNLNGVMGKPHAHMAGFAYSPGMTAMKGTAWNWDEMDKWLTSPKKYISDTKMSFAGLSKPQDRADLIVYINSQGSNLPVPPPPAAAAAAPAEGAPAEAAAAPADANAAAPAEAAAQK